MKPVTNAKRRLLLPGLLALVLCGCATVGGPAPTIVPGQSSREDVRKALGEPDEVGGDADTLVWVYGDADLTPPMADWIPVVGDLFSALDLLQDMRGRSETVIQFDAAGRVKRMRLRPLSP